MQFAFSPSSTIRTVVDDRNEVWFVAKDVATALGYENSKRAVQQHCKHTRPLSEVVPKLWQSMLATGNTALQDTHNLMPESDMYRLVMRSKLQSAEAFQDWIFEDVLPSIRKTGKYALPKKQLLLELEQKSLSGFEAFQKMTYSEQIAVYCALQDQKSPMVKYLVIDSYRDPIYFTPSQMSKKLGYKRQADFTNDLLASGLIDEDYHLLTEKGFRHGEYRAGSLRWCATVADALRPVWDEHNEEMRRRTFVPSSR